MWLRVEECVRSVGKGGGVCEEWLRVEECVRSG